MKYRIPLSYNPINIPGLVEVLTQYESQHHNQITVGFEEELKKFLGVPNVVALNSGTSAIHLALKVLGVGPGDCVIVPSFTYVATVNPVLYVGAQPVFIDSELETWNMDPSLLEKAVKNLIKEEKKPKAIIVVHTYGMPARMNEIKRIAKEYNIAVVEDAAESFGSEYFKRKAGTLGTIGIYSFNNNKVMTTYGGGAIVTDSPELAQKARFLATQARENLPYYEHREVGYNYVMSPLNAAVGLSQLPDLEYSIQERRRIFSDYQLELGPLNLQFQPECEGSFSNRWFSALLFGDEATKLNISSVLLANGIETRPLWKPMDQQQVFSKFPAYINGVSAELFKKGLCIPSGSNFRMEDRELVVRKIKENIRTS